MPHDSKPAKHSHRIAKKEKRESLDAENAFHICKFESSTSVSGVQIFKHFHVQSATGRFNEPST